MDSPKPVNIADLRALSKLVSHAAFKKLSANTNQSSYIRQLKKYVCWDSLQEKRPHNLEELIAYAYNTLEQNYRCEYIYKSSLLNNFVLGKYALSDTILLNEFRIGNSIADAVLINGTNKVFEIKTELDTPERLQSQLNDYYKAFSEVYVFTHYSLANKYLDLLPEYVGLVIYTAGGAVMEHRPATVINSQLDISTMMGSLRKAEYLKLVQTLAGFIPEATPVYMYKTCLKVLLCFNEVLVQKRYHKILKERISLDTNLYIEEQVFPNYLNFSFYQQNLPKKSYLTLISNLRKTV